MGVASSNELARTFENELGGSPKAVRTWAVTLSDDTLANNPTTHAAVINHLSLGNYGTQHPDVANSWFGLRKVTVTERFQDSPYHVQVVAEYGVISSNELLNPTQRVAEWAFEVTPGDVPALYYWDGSTRKALTNSAGDYFEGLTTQEQMVRATMKKNYADLPYAQIGVSNCINSDLYLTTNPGTWKCAGVNTAYTTEIYNNVSHNYWATTVELLFRQSGWNLQLPDVGWNYLSGGQKRRAMVFDYENAEWVASANPVALDGSGNQTSMPEILDRRVHVEANFTDAFGTPPA